MRPVPVNRSALRAAGPRRLVALPRLPRLPWRWQALALLAGSGAGWVLLAEGGTWAGRIPLVQSAAPWLLDTLARAAGLYLVLAGARALLATGGLTQYDAAPFLVRVHATIVQCAGLCVLAPLVLSSALIIAVGWIALATTGDTERARRWLRAGRRALHLGFLAE